MVTEIINSSEIPYCYEGIRAEISEVATCKSLINIGRTENRPLLFLDKN